MVGILEELNATLAVLENRVPYFFRGLQKIYFQDLMGMASQVSDSKLNVNFMRFDVTLMVYINLLATDIFFFKF